MNADKWLVRLEELLAQADGIAARPIEVVRQAISITGRVIGEFPDAAQVDLGAFAAWATSALDAIRKVFGAGGTHGRQFEQAYADGKPLYGRLLACRGVLSAARNDLAGGYLQSVRELASAEVFGDLLEQAEYLRERGYCLPAGALAGAVLEDALRRLCGKHGVTWSGDSGISKLGTELYKAGILAKPEHAKVDAWGKLRNQIDHGDFSKPADVDPNDVRRMIEGVRDFIVKHLT